MLAVLVFSAAAFAAVQDFNDFTVDVPDDWTATQNGTTVGIVANDNSAAVSITVDKRDGMEAKDLAATLRKINTKPNMFKTILPIKNFIFLLHM